MAATSRSADGKGPPASAPSDEAASTADSSASASAVGDSSVPLYTPSSLAACPPLARLQAYGLCCPFLETEEDHDARDCVNTLQNYPITWYRKKRVEDVTNDVRGAVPSSGGIMKGLGAMLGGTGKAEIPMAYVGVPATLTVVDTEEHGPLIEVRALETNDPDDAEARDVLHKFVTEGKPWWEDPIIKDSAPSKVIPVYIIDQVAAGWSLTGDATAGGVKLHAAPKEKGFLHSGTGPELLRFDTLGGGGSLLGKAFGPVKTDEPNKHSDKIIVQLRSLIDWNRTRMAKEIQKGNVAVAPKSSSPGYVAMS
ncbi:hypothetical protein ACHAXT_012814 [Thalassiosira profunda]